MPFYFEPKFVIPAALACQLVVWFLYFYRRKNKRDTIDFE